MQDIVDYTEALAATLGYQYQYGQMHWQNLIDALEDTELPFAEKQIYLLFLWHDEEDTINDQGSCEGQTITGELLLMVRSQLSDESQETKYRDAVKHLKTISSTVRDGYVDCDGFRVKNWRKIEVYDEFDTNMDGLKISFTIEKIEE